ncbi:Gfo/Idh/MocA family protein [Geminicoccus harenae]|uniref:Gfo/Idh/MocA family protein n=3 Tax=Geminicoccus harenae TaxID=2498453 RepID=UPI001C9389EC|nr:Gfo/Idh/MocA family oxidoreductase [Geminicoccus harenae]
MVGESSQAKAGRRRLRLGMVGGGQGAFIGAVHRLAARMDDRYELMAGAFSSTPEKSKASGAELGLPEARCYGSYAEMAQREARLKESVDVVAIVTPNHVHVPAALEFVRRGIHVICDKPLTVGMREGKKLADALAKQPDVVFVLTHNYTAYPMIRQARQMVADGLLGNLRIVQAEYAQDWLTTKLEDTGQKQAAWRNDPAQSGPVGAVGDIGTHAMNLAGFISGLSLKEVSADLTSFVEGRPLDDNAHIMLRYEGGAKGMLWASQVAPGNENALKVRIYGDKGGLSWEQENPNYLTFTPYGEPPRLITRGGAGAGPAAARVTRVPSGHPEGYLEGFANLYTDAAELILAKIEGREPDEGATLVPGIRQGLEGVKFCEAVVESSKKNGAWVKASV